MFDLNKLKWCQGLYAGKENGAKDKMVINIYRRKYDMVNEKDQKEYVSRQPLAFSP